MPEISESQPYLAIS